MTSGPRLPEALVERFLRVLGVPARPPGLEALRELTAAYVSRVPFENVSKVYRWKRLRLEAVPDAGLFLDGIEETGFGGTCYSNNFHLYALLAALGYDVRLCGADMAAPDVHTVVLATVEGREFLLDAGYAAPFLEPLPRDLAAEHQIALGRDRYVLRPRDAEGRSRLELHRDGVLKHAYVAKPAPRRLEDFEGVIRASFRPEATFRNALLLARFRPGEGLIIHKLTVIESRGGASTTRTLRDPEDLAAEVRRTFGIPEAILDEVLGTIGRLGDAWS